MDIFLNTKVDFLKYKMPAFLLSAVMILGGFVSIWMKGGLRYGVDFSGGTAIHLKFRKAVALDSVRKNLAQGGFSDAGVQGFSDPTEVLIRIPQKSSSAEQLTETSGRMTTLLNQSVMGQTAPEGRKDLNSVTMSQITQYMQLKDPLGVASAERYADEGKKLTELQKNNGGLYPAFEQMSGIDAKIVTALKEQFYVSDVASLSTEYVGPQVGADLRSKATLAVIWSLVGILVYIWVRFEFTWGAAVIMCLIHDVLVTLAFVSFFDREVSLTVIAAFLTIVGFSVNDTVVVYDRVRDNLKMMRTQPLEAIFNTSINQTLSRTILTSGTVFLVTIVLYVFGGAVINDFAFCMLVGVISGTYSTIYQASAMIVVYEKNFGRKKPQSVKVKASKVG
jgi:preprotein translocase subunit SecF